MAGFEEWMTRYIGNMKTLQTTLQYRLEWLNKFNADIDAKNVKWQALMDGTLTVSTPEDSEGDGDGDGTIAGVAPGDTAEAKVWNFFAGKGFAATAIAGVMGNLQQESTFSTTIVNPHSGAWGLGQWLGGRLTNLRSRAKKEGKDSTSLDFQLEFLWWELNGGDPTTKSKLNRLYGGMEKLKQMSVHDAVVCYEDCFERSGGSAMATRDKYAKAWYEKWGKNPPSTTTTSANPSDVTTTGYFTLKNGHITPPGNASTRISYNTAHAKATRANNGADLVPLPSDKFIYVGNTAHGKGYVNKYYLNALLLIYNQMQKNNMLIGSKMKISSAFRTIKPETGAADNGAHGWGGSVDIATSGLSQSVKLADICWGIGFRGIGVGKTFVHVDAGPPGVWSYGYGKYSGPGSIKAQGVII